VTYRQCALSSALFSFAALVAVPATAQISIGYPGPYGGAYDLTASVRLQVTPRDADVFVDGYYAGTVDDFDGAFQRLRAEPGEHEIQLFLPGHRSYTQKVYLQPGNTFNVRHTMERLAPGEAEPERPVGSVAARAPQRPRGRQPQAQTPTGNAPAAGGRSGAVTLRILPADAVVLIDAQRWDTRGEENLTVHIDAGRHTIEVQKSGYRGYLTEITVAPGQTMPLNISLAPE
jgi:hypothetical protein